MTTYLGSWGGGGFLECIDRADPKVHGRAYLVVGGDAGGLWISADDGASWVPCGGIPPTMAALGQSQRGITSVKWSKTHNGVLAAHVGSGGGGVLAISADFGRTWAVATGQPIPNAGAGGQATQPRAVGNRLFAVEGANYLLDIWWVGSSNGVWQVTFTGGSWQVTGAAPIFLSTFCLFDAVIDPQDPTTAYAVGCVNTQTNFQGLGQVWRITGLGTTNTVTAIRNTADANTTYAGIRAMIGPTGVTEIQVEGGGKLSGGGSTANAGGVWRCITPKVGGSPTFTQITAGLVDVSPAGVAFDNTQTIWSGMASGIVNGAIWIIISSSTPAISYNAPWFECMWSLVSEDGGLSWIATLLAQQNQSHQNQIYKFGGPTWWQSINHPEQALGRGNWACTDMALDLNTGGLWMTGRGGGFWTAAALVSSPDFYPFGALMGLTINQQVDIDPLDSRRGTLSNTDWTSGFWQNRLLDPPIQADLNVPAGGQNSFLNQFEYQAKPVLGVFVQDAAFTTTSAVATGTATLPVQSKAGRPLMLIVTVRNPTNTNTVLSVSDDAGYPGNTWARQLSYNRAANVPHWHIEVWMTTNKNPVPAQNVTFTLAAADGVTAHAFEMAGAYDVIPFDVAAPGSDDGGVNTTNVASGTTPLPFTGSDIMVAVTAFSVANITTQAFTQGVPDNNYAVDNSNIAGQVTKAQISRMLLTSRAAQAFTAQLSVAGTFACVAFGVRPNFQVPLIQGGGNRDTNNLGWLRTLTNPFDNNPLNGMVDELWAGLNTSPYTQTGVGSTISRLLAVAKGYDSSGQRVLIVAADADINNNALPCGIYRKVGQPGQGTWVRVDSTWPQNNAGYQNINPTLWWPNGSGRFIYGADFVQGILKRSDDWGLTWTTIWTFGTNDVAGGTQGFMRGDLAVPSTIYVSLVSKLWRIDNANNGNLDGSTGTIVRTDITGAMVSPSAICCHPWNRDLYVAELPSANRAPGLYRSTNQGASFTEITDPIFKTCNPQITWVEVAHDNNVVISTAGEGIWWQTPAADPWKAGARSLRTGTQGVTSSRTIAPFRLPALR